MKSTKRIFVNHVPRRDDPQGRGKQLVTYVDSNGQQRTRARGLNRELPMSTGTPFKFAYNSKTSMFQTGLEQEMSNPYFNADGKDTDKWIDEIIGSKVNWSREKLAKITTSVKIKRQTYLEAKYDRTEGFLTSTPSGMLLFESIFMPVDRLPEQKLTEIERFKLILYPNKTNVFDDTTLRGELAILLCENHPSIAPSLRETSPNTVYYISTSNEAEIERERLEDKENLAIAKLVKLYDSLEIEMYKIAILCTDNRNRSIVRGDMNKASIKSALNDYIKNSGKFQSEAISRFLKYMELMETNEGKNMLHVMYVVQQAINNNVIGMQDGMYTWYSKKSQPALYQISPVFEKLVNFFLKYYELYSEDDDETDYNPYRDLFNELKIRNVRF